MILTITQLQEIEDRTHAFLSAKASSEAAYEAWRQSLYAPDLEAQDRAWAAYDAALGVVDTRRSDLYQVLDGMMKPEVYLP